MKLPPYLYTNYDETARKLAVSVGDPTIKHQASMWGESFLNNIIAAVEILNWRTLHSIRSSSVLTISYRNHARTDTELDQRRFRGSHRDPPVCWCWLSSHHRILRHYFTTILPRPKVHLPKTRFRAPCRARRTGRDKSFSATTDKSITRRPGQTGNNTICCRYKKVEEAGAVQRKGNIRQ